MQNVLKKKLNKNIVTNVCSSSLKDSIAAALKQLKCIYDNVKPARAQRSEQSHCNHVQVRHKDSAEKLRQALSLWPSVQKQTRRHKLK